ncbi:hypothetical protein BDR06DRAFT_1000572 [Suillus hirtellus]|nr:hypothetical protein BDR06DRAFT_1000572 [Suillus hirtellus]
MYSLGNAYGLRPCALTPHIHLAPDDSYAKVTWTHDRPPYNGSKVYVWDPSKKHARIVARQFTAPEWAAEQIRLISERKLTSQDSYGHSLGGTYPYGLTHILHSGGREKKKFQVSLQLSVSSARFASAMARQVNLIRTTFPKFRECSLSTLQFDARTRSLAVDSSFDTPESPPVA